LLGQEFVKHGHQVTHISRIDQSLARTELLNGVNHTRVRGASAVKNPYLLKILELPYVLRTRKVMKEADILVTHAFWAPLLFPEYKFGKQYVHVGRHPKGQLKLYRKASRFQVPTTAVADICREQIPSQVSKVKILPYPLTWNPLPRLDFEKKEKIILYAGRIHPEKGVRALLEAWLQMPKELVQDWTLRLIGPWRQQQGGGGQQFYDSLMALTKFTVNNTEICEPIFDRGELKREMEKARFFIYPSISDRGETFGLAVLEAMSCGCVPIVSSLPCFSDFINFDVEGFRLNEKPGTSLIGVIHKKFHQIVETSEEKINKMAIASWRRTKHYEIKKVADQYLADFASLLS
jgi:glycosyltransferase involved in cell wall biosynthesis